MFNSTNNFKTTNLTIRYSIALSLVALLSISAYTLMHVIHHSLTADSPLINISGRQRMLSQKLSKEALLLAQSQTPEMKEHYRQLLKDTLTNLSRVHKGLQNGMKELQLPGVKSLEIRNLFLEIEPHYQIIKNTADKILILDSFHLIQLSPRSPLVQEIVQTSSLYLKWMDKMVFQYEKEAQVKVKTLKRYGMSILIMIMLLLLSEALFIFRPIVKKVKKNYDYLQNANEQLKQDVIERKMMEEKIQQQNKLLKNTLESLNYPFYVVDADDYTIKIANSAANKDSLTENSTCFALTHNRSIPCDSAEHPCTIKEIKKTKKPVTLEHIHYDKDDNAIYDEVHGYPIFDSEENIAQVIIYCRDITERKRIEEQIKASLEEKGMLLREIHHRVKNNLQVISSLLKLHSGDKGDKQYIEMLKDSQNRIKSMALIHEELYKSKDLANIDFDDYIKNLAKSLFRSYGISNGRIALKIDVEEVSLGIDTAIPCGLIINELISNSLKHAFPDDREGEIKIVLRLTDEDEIELTVSDNGVGIPEDLDFKKTESIGLKLVTNLAEKQLHGVVKLNQSKGTEFQILLKKIQSKTRKGYKRIAKAQSYKSYSVPLG